MASILTQIVPLPELPNIPVLDQETLEQIMEVDEGELGLLREMFGIFEKDTPARITALDAAIESDDLNKITELSHAMKGSCGAIGVSRVRAISALFEAYGRGHKIEIPPRELFGQLQCAYDEAHNALKNYIIKVRS